MGIQVRTKTETNASCFRRFKAVVAHQLGDNFSVRCQAAAERPVSEFRIRKDQAQRVYRSFCPSDACIAAQSVFGHLLYKTMGAVCLLHFIDTNQRVTGQRLKQIVYLELGLPVGMFYKTGISTYIWIVTNRKLKP